MSEYHPHADADLHPSMPTSLHLGFIEEVTEEDGMQFIQRRSLSPVALECERRDISIHDRHWVYEQMKKEGRA